MTEREIIGCLEAGDRVTWGPPLYVGFSGGLIFLGYML
jgi:hypothetical protein